MKERSLKDEMQAAVRGDIERSGVSLRPSPPTPAEEPIPVVEAPAEAEETHAAPPDETQPGFLSRIFGRR